jgi:2-methoxy-6-polyprenyl-1,4-benzoquinol methylase
MIGPMKMRKVLNEKGEVVSEVPLKIIDVAGGTGDISFRILDKAKKDSPGCKTLHFYSMIQYLFLELPVDILVSDINGDMLEVGKKRAVERGSFHGIY